MATIQDLYLAIYNDMHKQICDLNDLKLYDSKGLIVDVDFHTTGWAVSDERVVVYCQSKNICEILTKFLREQISIEPELLEVKWLKKSYGCAGDFFYLHVNLREWKTHVRENYEVRLVKIEQHPKKRKLNESTSSTLPELTQTNPLD